MLRIWISHHSSIPVREQLSAQVMFGILSGRLQAAERLPSIRDLARRLEIHPNTVSAAYQDLAARGWVQRKTGSGVYVCDIKHEHNHGGIDAFVRTWIDEGARLGFSLEALGAEFERARHESSSRRGSQGLLVVHSDLNLARILAAELEEAIHCAVPCASPEEALASPDFETHLILTTASGAASVAQQPRERRVLIPLRSVEQIVAGLKRPSTPVLIGLVSRSEAVLKWASLLVPALGIAGSDLITRNPEHPGWQDGLGACEVVAADVLAARELPKGIRPIVLRLTPDSFLDEARRLVAVEKA